MKIKLFLLFIIVAVFFFVLSANKKEYDSVAKTELFELADVKLIMSDTLKDNVPSIPAVENIKDMKTLEQYYYSVDKKTALTSDLFDVNAMSTADLHIDKSKEPSVLVFHTHGSEKYADNDGNNAGVIGAGDRLCSLLKDKYGISSLHITNEFDKVDGNLQRDGAYERAEPVITQVLAENPSIQLVIDLHRDGVNENLHLVKNINGKNCAKIMFFNGICRKWDNGKLVELNNLNNPYLSTNLALSFQMYNKMNELYPGITRKIYINAYRYSLHMKDKSMLIELGAQTNTIDEVYNTIDMLAETINCVVG
jgi:stage II sporulation protein P